MEGICKTFPGVKALENVDFNLQKGAVHILLGENGAGKSTLVKILSGAYKLTSGKIFINNQLVTIRNPQQAMDLGIGIIYQELNLIPNLTAAENIYLGREPVTHGIKINSRLMKSQADKILSQLGIKINLDSAVKDLGIAQQQMVEVAKAISLNANILIMDEPTSALSESEINELFKTIEILKVNGISIIYISHRMEELFEIGDLVTILRDGKKVGTKLIQDTNREELIRLMVNRKINELFIREEPQLGKEVLKIKNMSRRGVLNKINFSLHKGEILGIAGLLGSGRTELARSIFGADPIDSGSILVNGKNTIINSPSQAIRNGIGFLTEDRKTQGLVMTMSIKENITLPSLNRLSKWGVINSQNEHLTANKYRKELDIRSANQDHLVFNLSGGNQQKVVLSKWLCSKANIFIFDEPTRGIDVRLKQEFYRLMNDLTASGVSIIMISSELPELISVSDRIIVMHEGEIISEYSRPEFSQENILHSALGGYGEA
ncbi:MAG: sugar ABC transporter ATP-binding protein [Candidatus Neomarinimicrobiota bacterium]